MTGSIYAYPHPAPWRLIREHGGKIFVSIKSMESIFVLSWEMFLSCLGERMSLQFEMGCVSLGSVILFPYLQTAKYDNKFVSKIT